MAYTPPTHDAVNIDIAPSNTHPLVDLFNAVVLDLHFPTSGSGEPQPPTTNHHTFMILLTM